MTPPRAAVLGDPIEHSLSPRLHAAGYAAAGLEGWEYGRHRVAEAELAGFLEGREEVGFSLTMPLKARLVALARERGWGLGAQADTTAVGNTLILPRGGAPRVENTDVEGIRFALTEGGRRALTVDRAVILGGGATAASALVAVHELGAAHADVVMRAPAKGRSLVDLGRRLGVGIDVHGPHGWWALAARAEVGISTLPGGAADGWADAAAGTRIGADQRLLDVAYSQGDSRLSAAWRRAGGTTRPGADMLVGQALVQFSLFAEAASQPLTPQQIGRVRDAMQAVARD